MPVKRGAYEQRLHKSSRFSSTAVCTVCLVASQLYLDYWAPSTILSEDDSMKFENINYGDEMLANAEFKIRQDIAAEVHAGVWTRMKRKLIGQGYSEKPLRMEIFHVGTTMLFRIHEGVTGNELSQEMNFRLDIWYVELQFSPLHLEHPHTGTIRCVGQAT